MVKRKGLIQNSYPKVTDNATPIFNTTEDDFKFEFNKNNTKSDSEIIKPQIIEDKPKQSDKHKKLSVSKNNPIKTIKLPLILHRELNILGNFIGDDKMYEIIDKLIKSYTENELTHRQLEQFKFLIEDIEKQYID